MTRTNRCKLRLRVPPAAGPDAGGRWRTLGREEALWSGSGEMKYGHCPWRSNRMRKAMTKPFLGDYGKSRPSMVCVFVIERAVYITISNRKLECRLRFLGESVQQRASWTREAETRKDVSEPTGHIMLRTRPRKRSPPFHADIKFNIIL